jgi:hypothetical protein
VLDMGSVPPMVLEGQKVFVYYNGPKEGQTRYGIYALEDNKLKLCMGEVGQPRPTEFAAKPGSGNTLRVFKRVKE